MHDVNETEELDDPQRDPDYDPDSGQEEGAEEPTRNDDSEDLFEDVDGYRREAPGNTPGGLLEVDSRGRVPRRPRNVAQACEAVVTCPIPGCHFSGRNVRRHLRGQPHMFNDKQVERVIEAEDGVRPRHRIYAHLACPLLGQVMINEKVCTTKSTSRLDLHLPKHGLFRGTPQYALAYSRAQTASRREAGEAVGDFELMFAQYKFRAEGRHSGKAAKAGTTAGVRSALKLFLSAITASAIRDLSMIGDKGGKLDQFREKGSYKPK